MFKLFLSVLLLISMAMCTGTSSQEIAPVAQNYINEVILLLEKNSVNKHKIDGKQFKDEVYTKAGNAQTIEETYPSISHAITLLGDHHSYFAPNIPSGDEEDSKPLPVLRDEQVPENIGYIRIRFCIGNEEQNRQYINAITNRIKQQDKHNLRGWIVDLRGNFGGNMWPMLAGVGPLLCADTVGYFINADGKSTPWVYKSGAVYNGKELVTKAERPYVLKSAQPFIAVLTDSITASSGEAIAVAFRGRKNTRSFGVKTFGVSTGNNSHQLSDGSRINLTESIFADKQKQGYGSSIVPDVECGGQQALTEAVIWLSCGRNKPHNIR